MVQLPIEFISEATATQNFEQSWMISSGTTQTACAIPPEFGGMGGGFSPEDLFLQAAMNCFIGTFKVVAKLSKVTFTEVKVTGKLIVDKNEAGKIVMKSIQLGIILVGADRPDRVEQLVAKTIRDGYILNSIRSEVNYTIECQASVG